MLADVASAKKGTQKHHLCVPWFTEECRMAQHTQKKAQRLAFHHPTQKMFSFKCSWARAHFIFKQHRKIPWQRFVSSCSCTTSHVVWEMRKIMEKFQAGSIGHLQVGDYVLTWHEMSQIPWQSPLLKVLPVPTILWNFSA